ncbi:hypothetical protein CEP50_04660 [Actinopolyspora mortivallis]|uniref:Uncharacterized protein n=1 Tax=Actinopolyspora mortivallis TaxID=33906 RepID=A0A2T0GZV3_ACTMO|nr:hypothetical protein CEP50_04660 [Actinopolyspora mortivallis]
MGSVFTPEQVEALTGFRFTDGLGLTGRALCDSSFRKLPEFARDVVTERLGLRPGQWDALSGRREVLAITGVGRWDLPVWLPCVRRQLTGAVRGGWVCGDCDGSCAQVDWDGSITGTVGAAALCFCLV